MNGFDESTISVTDDEHNTIYVPMLFPDEARGENNREMPFIEMTLMTEPNRTRSVDGVVHDETAYLDFHIYYAKTDNITPRTFGKAVADELVDKITQNRHSVSGCSWMEVSNKGREMFEQAISGKQVVFHRVVEIFCLNYSNG
jgi:hypothetical protein